MSDDKPKAAAIKAISMWQPWAWWVMRGWKTIETRTHDRFKGLSGQRIAIHAAKTWDISAIKLAGAFLTTEQVIDTMRYLQKKIGGVVLGTVFVGEVRWLSEKDEPRALIECKTRRFGLSLLEVKEFEKPIPASGLQGIWNFKKP